MPYHSGMIQFDMTDSLLGITDVSNTVKSISGVPLIYWYYSYCGIHCKRFLFVKRDFDPVVNGMNS